MKLSNTNNTVVLHSQYFVLALLDQLMIDTAEPDKPAKSFTVFYDIGCTFETSVKNVKLFLLFQSVVYWFLHWLNSFLPA